jgi:hypothetical protein
MSGISAVVKLLTGKEYQDTVSDYPMFRSTSPRDFWGRRWNLLIHHGLKQGVYKPVRWHTSNKYVASLAAFVMSGIQHEIVWRIMFFQTNGEMADGDHCTTCYHSAFGKQLWFFGWNGVLIVLEHLAGPWFVFLKLYLHPLVISHLVVFLSLPVGHLFAGDIVCGGYFEHLRFAFALVKVAKHR